MYHIFCKLKSRCDRNNGNIPIMAESILFETEYDIVAKLIFRFIFHIFDKNRQFAVFFFL